MLDILEFSSAFEMKGGNRLCAEEPRRLSTTHTTPNTWDRIYRDARPLFMLSCTFWESDRGIGMVSVTGGGVRGGRASRAGLVALETTRQLHTLL